MLKKIAFAGLGIGLLVTPLLTQATSPVLCQDGQTAPNHANGRCPEWVDDTGNDLQTIIDGLLAKVRQLQAQLETLLKQPSVTPTPPVDYSRIVCLRLDRFLAFGAKGDDVAALQKVLIGAGILSSDSATGYFGAATQAAVQRLQAANGIVSSGDSATTGWGAIGPATRAWFLHRCGNQNFFASPSSGAAPLTVTFSTNISGQGGQQYTIEYGDGSSAKANYCYSPLDFCQQPGINTHTYATVGTFTAQLKRVVGVREVQSGDTNIYEVVGTATITVGTQTTAGSFSASPTYGAAPLTGTFSVTRLPSDTNDVYYTVTFGDGADGGAAGFDRTVTTATVQHTYAQNGSYTATMYRRSGCSSWECLGELSQVASFTITAGSAAVAGAPSISAISGPASLATSQSGTWTVHASVPNGPNTQLRYSVIWGDEGVLDTLNAFAGTAASTLQTSGSFTHLYARAGTYHPTFTVSNDAGSAQASASVVVGKDTTPLNCPQYMAPLCNANETLVGGGYGADGCQLSPRCVSNTTTTSSGSLSASPKEGDAPLAVTFTGAGNNLSFGDDGPVLIANGAGAALGTVTHLYLGSGTYTATSDGRSVNIKVNMRKGTTREELFAPSSCVYDNRTYTSGTSVDVPTKTCTRDTSYYGALCEKLALTGTTASITSQRYTCQSGQWFDSNKTPFEGDLVGATSCMASGGTTVANGQIIVQGSSAAAWMFDQQYNTYGKRIPTMKCSNGNWLDCDAYGNNCTQASADTNTNLANALTALESAIRAFIANLR